MIAVFFIIAVVLMIIGHIFKVKRWGLFIAVYEEPYEGNLLNALSFGHTLNAVLHIRIGDIVRGFWAGRRVKNGYSFTFATVAADLYVDILTVGMMFFVLAFIGKGGEELQQTAKLYRLMFFILIPLTALSFIFRKGIKKAIQIVAGVFNAKIEYGILYVSYLCIASVKDIARNIDKVKFILYTIGIWIGYVSSYVVFAEAVQRYGFYYSTSDVFAKLFGGASLYHIERNLVFFWGTYIILPLFVCWIISMVMDRGNSPDTVFKKILPMMNKTDRYAFLKTYYKEDNREHIQAYLELNSDVAVVEDNSAGSNASTVLVMKPNGELFYRKYAFDEDGDKLQEQIDWIEQHQTNIPLPIVVDQHRGSNYVTYDMHNYGSSIGFFRYIHTMPVDKSWEVLRVSLDDIRTGLHSKSVREADRITIEKYIDSKVFKNIRIITEDDKFIRQLEQGDEIVVNGNKLHTMSFYQKMFDKDHLIDIFKGDDYSEIHGDLTIENIVYLGDKSELNCSEYEDKIKPDNYYFIDPNTGNLHNSPFLDYAKLLQSLHGNYEFLMMVKNVKIDKNNVSFMFTKSEVYGKLYQKYTEYLRNNFTEEQILSIYYHEIIHWLRLMPYKIRKDEKLAVVFYTGLLVVLNDVWELEYGKKK